MPIGIRKPGRSHRNTGRSSLLGERDKWKLVRAIKFWRKIQGSFTVARLKLEVLCPGFLIIVPICNSCSYLHMKCLLLVKIKKADCFSKMEIQDKHLPQQESSWWPWDSTFCHTTQEPWHKSNRKIFQHNTNRTENTGTRTEHDSLNICSVFYKS